jgi:hypothetical protein
LRTPTYLCGDDKNTSNACLQKQSTRAFVTIINTVFSLTKFLNQVAILNFISK